MAKKLAFLVLAFAFCLTIVSTAAAQDRPLMLTVHAGFAKLMEDNAPSGSFGVGGGIAYMLQSMPNVAIGAEASYLNLGSDAGLDWSVIPVTAQIMFFFQSSGPTTVPFMDAGVGLYNLRVKYEGNTESDNKAGINFGGGLKLGGGRMAFGAEARYHVVFTEHDSTNMLTIMGKLFF